MMIKLHSYLNIRIAESIIQCQKIQARKKSVKTRQNKTKGNQKSRECQIGDNFFYATFV